MIKVLLEAGASLSAVNIRGMTPLHRAAWEGYTEVTKVLVKAGASVSAVDNNGWTPLHLAAGEGHTEVTKVLLEAGASLSAVDKYGKTPHDVAKDNVKKLLQKYAASRADMVLQVPMMGTAEEMKELISNAMNVPFEISSFISSAVPIIGT